MVRAVTPGHGERRALLALLVRLGLKGFLGSTAQKESPGRGARKARPVRPDRLALPDCLGHPAC
jgi:hypothetical protein